MQGERYGFFCQRSLRKEQDSNLRETEEGSQPWSEGQTKWTISLGLSLNSKKR